MMTTIAAATPVISSSRRFAITRLRSVSEIQLCAEFDEATQHDVRRPAPAGAVSANLVPDVVRVEHVERVDVTVNAHPAHVACPFDRDVQLIEPVLDCVPGCIRGSVRVAVHTGLVPHWPRFRPSDGAISAFVAT